MFVRWLAMHDRCNVCGLQFLPKQGDVWLFWIVMDRIPIAIGLILVGFFGLRVATWQMGALFFGVVYVKLCKLTFMAEVGGLRRGSILSNCSLISGGDRTLDAYRKKIQ